MLEALSSAAGSAHGGTDLFNLAERRMNWLESRESTLAGNVANANTPGYVPKDSAPFQGVLQNQMTMMLAQTEPGHMAGHVEPTRTDRSNSSTSPDKNEVTLEDELEKIASTNDDQLFATTVYTRYMSMFSTALGTSS
ncbi:flagellar basal body rod protein FlgB [Komagataeibacter kakiaceti JCM 25156]|uniref:flagellar basal body rod protein FlgB n=1 Tax=Komagataeibacter kakiaceti TaxID=943261 RepID=UPI000558CBB0|nr:flagellar basal body protein [Komagataeibacter kakiaceti]